MKVVIDSTVTRDKQNEGVWGEYGGSKFLLGHMGNIRFQRVLTRLQAPHRQKIMKGSIDPAEARKIMCRAMSTGLVFDWKDVVDSKGEERTFTPELCEQMLLNNDDVREFIAEFTQELSNFKEEQAEAEGKS